MASVDTASAAAGAGTTPMSPTMPSPLNKIRSGSRLSYGWREVHEDLEKGNYCGRYGADHTAYHGLASLRAGVDMHKAQTSRTVIEPLVPELETLLKNEGVQKCWESITTFDPMGMFASHPTQSATYACMYIPELSHLEPDGKIVKEDGGIPCIKAAVDFAWNLPGLATLLNMDEDKMRKVLSDHCENTHVLDKSCNVFLPPVGGITVYFIGDPSKLADPTTEVAVRCHDACCGSDVFGTDICTCRPYLIYAIQGAVETAKRGGVGVIVYFRKEGRSLGEVIKFRVYNARKAQPGGDTAENYFKVTEAIAGIRDARFQEMMPDILLWLGIKRIDWLLSMSSDKYDAIASAGIEVMQRVSLPDMFVPKGATVEITAKIAAGYHTDKLESEEIINDLRTLDCVRARCGKIFELAKRGKARHFSLDMDKLPACIDAVVATTNKNYPAGSATIPYHSRWRHFNMSDVDGMVDKWPVDEREKVRRMIDLVTVSVLLDAGAGPEWSYEDDEGRKLTRSEGLATASLDMFKDGIFSSDVAMPHRVNSHGLKALQLKQLLKGFQVSKHNPMVGVEGRYGLLQRLGAALDAHPEFFGTEMPRPGNLVDYVLSQAKEGVVSIRALWKAVIEGYESIWPDTHTAVRRGDVWVYSPLKIIGQPGSDMVPFHKLSQWLTYSLLEPLERLGIRFSDMDLMTGLAEYRNGGLFVDAGVLVPKREDAFTKRTEYDVGSELVVEWRALTVALLDLVGEGMRGKLGMSKDQMPLAKVLQGGTWATGREYAKSKREDGSSPIPLRLDGTVF